MHLDQRHIDMVHYIIQEHIPEYEVWLFGSRTHGKHLHHGSDIDLCIRTLQTPLPSLRYSRLKSAFEDSDLPYFVDVVDWASISESFRKIIEQEYEVIWEGKPQ